ncbi:MAG: hypothetical protein IKH75_00535 [Ruminococcus sp.]|nr:hypothetical protein [Ruminococcus sp.]
MVKVKNLNGTSNRVPSDGSSSWQEWWEKKKKRKFGECSRINCSVKAEVGAHVQKALINDRRWYIVPLCRACNSSKSENGFYVDEKDLEPVNQ